MSASWSSRRAASKMPPKLEGASNEVFVLSDQFVIEGHGDLLSLALGSGLLALNFRLWASGFGSGSVSGVEQRTG
jgi:hypothetical protein